MGGLAGSQSDMETSSCGGGTIGVANCVERMGKDFSEVSM